VQHPTLLSRMRKLKVSYDPEKHSSILRSWIDVEGVQLDYPERLYTSMRYLPSATRMPGKMDSHRK
jgi:hypothetical protein